MLSWVHHSTRGTQEGILHVHTLLHEPLLHCAWQSAAVSHTAIYCCITHGNPLLHRAQRSTAMSCMAIHCCIARGDLLLCCAWQSAAVLCTAMHQGQPMAQAMVM